MAKTSALASALRSSGARVAAAAVPEASPPEERPAGRARQPSREGTKTISVHQPAQVHQQLKLLAAEQDRFMDDLVAEAFNLLFAKYRKAEIAPRKANK